MCSRKCDTPATSADSSRLPALTKNPEATDRAWSFSSAMTWRPLSRTVWWNCIEEASAEDGRGGSPHRRRRSSKRGIHRGGRRGRKSKDSEKKMIPDEILRVRPDSLSSNLFFLPFSAPSTVNAFRLRAHGSRQGQRVG